MTTHFDRETTMISAATRVSQEVDEVARIERIRSKRTSLIRSASITLTRGGLGLPVPRLLSSLSGERAFTLFVPLEPLSDCEMQRSGRLCKARFYPRYYISLSHMGEEPPDVLPPNCDVVQLHIPELALRELSPNGDLPTFDKFWKKASCFDPIIGDLARAAAAAIDLDAVAGDLLFDYIILAIHARLIGEHSDRRHSSRPGARLTICQERRAKELLTADLSDNVPLVDIANDVGVPAGRFGAAFRATTGLPPYKWLRHHRVENAKGLLLGSTLTLADIAYACGFADQSHFTRVFNQHTGMPPGRWRRSAR